MSLWRSAAKVVVVVAGCRLAGLFEPASVVGDHSMAVVQQRGDLFVLGAAAERVAVDEHYGPPRSVVFLVHVDRLRVLLAEVDVRHRFPSVGSIRQK
jgi:hypothetical protein